MIRELEQIQNMVVRLILQVPSATSRVLAWIDSGLKPMEDRIKFPKALFIFPALKSKHNYALISAFLYLLGCPNDKWIQSWMYIKHVMSVMDDHSTMSVVPQPATWFSLQDHMSDSMMSRSLCRVRCGNVELENRFKNKFNRKFDVCPSCAALGIHVNLRESMSFLCPLRLLGSR